MPIAALALCGAASFAGGFGAGRLFGKGQKKKNGGVIDPRWRTPEAFQVRGKQDAVVVVDPISTGARLAYEAQRRGYKVIRVLSAEFPESVLRLIPENCKDLEFAATITNSGNAKQTAKQLLALNYHIVACLIGCESGVEFFDALTEAMPGFPTNGTASSGPRRDKYLMGERVRSAGLRAVKQQECRGWSGDASAFVAALGVREDDPDGPWCVLKPTKSAGTDGVFISKTAREARECFDKILGAANVFGESNQTVLVQEFLKGTEYVIDSVSLEGQHKCVAIWEYDKRPCNGAQFVYFGMRLYQSDTGAREQVMVDYVHKVIDALGVRHGPTHAEVMWLDGEQAPCLVEVGCRPHGGEGTFVDLVQQVIGYSKISVMLDTFDKAYRFKRLPTLPARFEGGSVEVDLVSRQEGILAGYPLLEQVKKLRSFHTMEIKMPVGSRLEKTVDFLTTPGCINLVHKDRRVVDGDMAWIEKMQEQGKFYVLADPELLRVSQKGHVHRETSGYFMSPGQGRTRTCSTSI